MRFFIERQKLDDGRWRVSIFSEVDYMLYESEDDAAKTVALLKSTLDINRDNKVFVKVSDVPKKQEATS